MLSQRNIQHDEAAEYVAVITSSLVRSYAASHGAGSA